jgi:WD40 repeat protein
VSTFDQVFIDPQPGQWDGAFAGAVAAANARYRSRTITWPPAQFADFLGRLLGEPEGMAGWHGGARRDYWEGRSQVVAVWWGDRLGRKHLRILGGEGKELCRRMRFGAGFLGRESLSPLEQVYPQHTARYATGGPPRLLAVCGCGAVGAPEALGWMGPCCGPCHDRRADGEPAGAPVRFKHCEPVCLAVAFGPDSRTLAVGRHEVRLYDLTTGQVAAALRGVAVERGGLAFTADGKRLAVAGITALTTWDVDQDVSESWAYDERVWHLAVSPDATLVALAGRIKGEVEVRRASDGAPQRKVQTSEANKGHSGVAFSPDGRWLATAAPESPLQVWDVRTGARLHEFADDLHPATLAFSPDGRRLARLCNRRDGEVRVWDLTRREALPPLPQPTNRRGGLCTSFSPEGGILVVAGDGLLSAWDLADVGRRLDLQWTSASLLSLASSPDGRWLAVGDNHGEVILWAWETIRALLAGAQPGQVAGRGDLPPGRSR